MGQPPTPAPSALIFMNFSGAEQHATGVNEVVKVVTFPHSCSDNPSELKTVAQGDLVTELLTLDHKVTMMFRIVFWDVLPCKMIVPEDSSEHHTRRRENLKSHIK
jgi:hypothetical protein